MPGPAFTTGDTVSLHPIEPEDHEFVQRGRNDPDVRVPLTDTTIRTLSDVEEMLEDEEYHFVICSNSEDEDPEPVGVVAFGYVSGHADRGSLMYWVAPEHQGNGYVTEATELFLDYAFRECGFHKVTARVNVSNEPSAAVLESLGFVQEGRRRKESVVDGEREDMFTYGLLADEWLH
ncbi:GNAT family N-acetyltransferase [Halobacterium wangiae]|uniref:GNAT family N-acetyltransferase n=1 Tax=Halobacterium wangiae TaxID=2902623 RepID=UPI001E5AD7FF|nr:GNAT family protein [Halobacterium wangiae]